MAAQLPVWGWYTSGFPPPRGARALAPPPAVGSGGAKDVCSSALRLSQIYYQCAVSAKACKEEDLPRSRGDLQPPQWPSHRPQGHVQYKVKVCRIMFLRLCLLHLCWRLGVKNQALQPAVCRVFSLDGRPALSITTCFVSRPLFGCIGLPTAKTLRLDSSRGEALQPFVPSGCIANQHTNPVPVSTASRQPSHRQHTPVVIRSHQREMGPANVSCWSASVPMDLTEAITAAVGHQPVPQLPACVRPSGQQLSAEPTSPTHQQQPCRTVAVPTQCHGVDPHPVSRRPTAAEVRAASPPAANSLLLSQEEQEARLQAQEQPVLLDGMDNLQLQDSSSMQLSQQQQQQLLNQLWSELQAPPQQQDAGSAAVHQGSCKPDQPRPVVHLRATNSAQLSTSASLQSSSSCCSSDPAVAAGLALAAAAAAPAVELPTGAAAPDSPCSSVQSRALSSCSTSSSKKRVSWGDPVVHLLPSEEPAPLLVSLWHSVCDWWAPHEDVIEQDWHSSSTWSPAAAATTAALSVAAVAAVAACIAHRSRSS